MIKKMLLRLAIGWHEMVLGYLGICLTPEEMAVTDIAKHQKDIIFILKKKLEEFD